MEKALLSILVALPFAFVQSLLIAEESFPRTPSGKPDFSGNYDASSLTPMNRCLLRSGGALIELRMIFS